MTVNDLDSIRLAVTGQRFEGIVRIMTNTLLRAGRSGVINTARDFSCCVLSSEDELVAMAESLPVHVVGGSDLMARTMREMHPRLRRGDAFLHNSPYHGNTHAADHAILVPVVDDDGVHRFTVMAKAHQADCGNAQPTTYLADVRDVYEEGALIFPAVRVEEDYRPCSDVIRMCELRMRVPDQWHGDYLALLGAARVGERRLLALGDDMGWDELTAYAAGWLDYGEARMAAAIAELPSGRVTVETMHDPVASAPSGVPIRVTVAVRADDREIEVDLRDNLDCQPFGLNLTEGSATSAAMVGIFNGIHAPLLPNAGSFRRVRVLLRENCIVGIPRHPVSCSAGSTNLFDRTANAVQRGLAELIDGSGMAEVGLSFPASAAVVSGHDPRRDEPFVNQIFFAWTGGAGGPKADGWLNQGSVGDGGALLRDSVEVDELKHPIRIWEQRIVPDSEGAGRRRGAPAARLEYGPVACEMEVMFLSDGTVHPAEGVRGGRAGAPATQAKRSAAGTLTPLANCDRVVLKDGETLVSTSCGGGGYGAPEERELSLVASDVREGWISPERARAVYRAVVDAHGDVDARASAALRRAVGTA